MKFEFDENSPVSYEEQHSAWLLTRDTVDNQLTADHGDGPTYPGSDGEHFDAPHRQTTAITKQTKPSAGELCRRICYRRR